MKLFICVAALSALASMTSGVTLESKDVASDPAEQPGSPASTAGPFLHELERASKLRAKIAVLEDSLAPSTLAAGNVEETCQKSKKGKKCKGAPQTEAEKARATTKLLKKKAELAALEEQLVKAGVDVNKELTSFSANPQLKQQLKEAKVVAKEASRKLEEELRQAWFAHMEAEGRSIQVTPVLPLTTEPIDIVKAKIAKLEAKLEELKFHQTYLETKEAKPDAEVRPATDDSIADTTKPDLDA